MDQRKLIGLITQIYDTYKDLYLSEKKREERLLQGVQSANGLQVRVQPKKADGTEITVTTTENAITKAFGKRFAISLNFDFFKHLLNFFKHGFTEEHSNVTWEEFLTTKFGLWIDTRSTTDNTIHGSAGAVGKSGILLQIEKATKSNGGDLICHVFSLEDAMVHLVATDPSGILT